METNKANSFKEFYTLIALLPGYHSDRADEIKEELVSSYTEGKTTSLREMREVYPGEYSMMLNDLRRKTTSPNKKYSSEGEKWRRRVIAAICSYLDSRGKRFADNREKIAYAMSIAQRAASVENFNKVSITDLQRVYNTFGNRKSYKEIDEAGYVGATIGDWTYALNEVLKNNNIQTI